MGDTLCVGPVMLPEFFKTDVILSNKPAPANTSDI